MAPSRTSDASRLPPKSPGHRPPNASWPAGRDGDAAEHRLERHFEALARGVRQVEDADHALPIEPPGERPRRQRIVQHPRAIVGRDAADAARVVARDRRVAIGPEPHDLDDQRVARRGALDVERARLRRARRRLRSSRPGCEKVLRLDRGSRRDAQHRLAHGIRLHAGLGRERYDWWRLSAGGERRGNDGERTQVRMLVIADSAGARGGTCDAGYLMANKCRSPRM